eukprot:comp9111_c0_seq1/m.4279 comp9111_c0_seq1/g.4279  ORF comp9111_c0_seq1/g.4279 comp9111_c0_seq1/m.4279 type:complete len:353 (-) comp9111_c0_seq1:439-1497(-)
MGLAGRTCLVTGGSGFVGRRLVELLTAQGAGHVRSFDLRVPAVRQAGVEYVQGDLRNRDHVLAACRGVHSVWHVGAAVLHQARPMYRAVNYEGTLHVLAACRAQGVSRLVYTATVGSRAVRAQPLDNAAEDTPFAGPGRYLDTYCESKALAEQAVRSACCSQLRTVAVAPHVLYGPRDPLFWPQTLWAAQQGKLRRIGTHDVVMSFVHVDNFCHALLCAHEALQPGSRALGGYYSVRDLDGNRSYWQVMDQAVRGMGLPSFLDKRPAPVGLVFGLARAADRLAAVTGRDRPYAISESVLELSVTSRTFSCSAAQRDLGYNPPLKFEEGWEQTIEWFRENQEWWMERGKAMLG